MKWHFRKISLTALILLAFWGLVIVFIAELGKNEKKQLHYDEKLKASKLSEQAMHTIRDYRRTHLLPWDTVSDPNNTGMIGEEFSITTTDQGELASKLTATNPNLSALIVELLYRAGVKIGDRIAISWTGSFPALNISLLSAIETMGLKATIITSLGASMWGANIPEFTWLDMEKILFDTGIFHYRSVAVTLGGRNDIGANLSTDVRTALRESAKRNNIKLIEEKDLHSNIQKRMELYGNSNYKVYINVGGGLGSIGSNHNITLIGNGLIKNLPQYNYPISGTMILFGEKGIPIINLDDIKKLAQKYNFPIAPEPIPPVPSGILFFREEYNLTVIILLLLSYLTIIFFVVKGKK